MKQVTRQYSLKICTLEDSQEIVNIYYKAYKGSVFNDTPFDVTKVLESTRLSLENPDAITVILYKKGEACGLLYATIEEVIFNDTKFARKGIWWTNKDPKAAVILFKAFKQWAKTKGVTKLVFGSHEDSKFFTRNGLEKMETHYWGTI